jgi:hypothetical protein
MTDYKLKEIRIYPNDDGTFEVCAEIASGIKPRQTTTYVKTMRRIESGTKITFVAPQQEREPE